MSHSNWSCFIADLCFRVNQFKKRSLANATCHGDNRKSLSCCIKSCINFVFLFFLHLLDTSINAVAKFPFNTIWSTFNNLISAINSTWEILNFSFKIAAFYLFNFSFKRFSIAFIIWLFSAEILNLSRIPYYPNFDKNTNFVIFLS